MLDTIGERQKGLLELLLQNKGGMTVDDLADKLGVTRNAVRQHLATLEISGLLEKGVTRPTGGRPEQLYVLTAKGYDLFPKQYSWFAQLLFDMVKHVLGDAQFNERLAEMGRRIGSQLDGAHPVNGRDTGARVQQMAAILTDLGYRAHTPSSFKGIPVIEADNCVFHDLARKDPVVCQFDLALMSEFTQADVVHAECMATGGHICRFHFVKKT